MTPPDLRTLVERLPKEIEEQLPCFYCVSAFWRMREGLSVGPMIWSDKAADLILGHLVRWLGERNWIIDKSDGRYLAAPSGCYDDPNETTYATPLEAAVEGVRVIWESGQSPTAARP